MKKIVTVTFLLLSGSLMAQTSEAYWRPELTLIPSENQVIVATLPGTGAGAAGSTQAIINQHGAGNRFSFDGAAGNTGNLITFTQNGNSNQLDFSLAGSNNAYAFTQNGDSNVLNLQNFRTNGVRLEIEQTGNGNNLTSTGGNPLSTGTPLGGIPLRITQSGGMSLIISTSFLP